MKCSFKLGTGAVKIRPPDQASAAKHWQDKIFLGQQILLIAYLPSLGHTRSRVSAAIECSGLDNTPRHQNRIKAASPRLLEQLWS